MRTVFVAVMALVLVIGLIGCNVSKPYITTTDRTDQQISGNRGYLKGTPPPAEDRTGIKREFIAVDIDLPEIKGKATRETKIVAMPVICKQVCGAVKEMTNPSSAKSASEKAENIK